MDNLGGLFSKGRATFAVEKSTILINKSLTYENSSYYIGHFPFVLAGCTGQKQSANDFIQENIDNAVAQETLQTDIIEKSGEILNPRTIDEEGNIHYIPIDDWCSGFFPGNIWYAYELTGDKKWLPLAEKYTEALDSVQYLTWHHDVGFMIGSSYLNGYRFANKEEYKPVIIQTARSLSTRFRPNPGVIQSWDADKGWQAKRGWKCPVIIDNMMNLELMFEATRLSGDSTFYDIARKHADTTMANHFRADNSCYHVVDYDPETGEVRKKQTAQGYADESAWARGQAWALYGYTMCYRYTHDVKYLEQAEKYTALSLITRIFRKIWFPTGTSMLPRFLTSLVMLPPLHVRLLPSMS